MTVINTNIKALRTQEAMQVNDRSLAAAMAQLSSGKRINSAADDAAGLAISTRMTSQIRGLDQAVRNAGDAISLLQTTEGATQAITDMLQRMRELAIQARNDTNSDTERSYLNLEFAQLQAEITRITENTTWNNFNTLDGSAGTSGELTFQVGVSSGQTISIELPDFNGSSVAGAVTASTVAVSTASGADAAMALIDTALDNINRQRANMGAVMNRLNYAMDNLSNISTSTQQSRSRIQDADYAKASSDLARAQIIQQAATAVLAQANTSQQSVLKLLNG